MVLLSHDEDDDDDDVSRSSRRRSRKRRINPQQARPYHSLFSIILLQLLLACTVHALNPREMTVTETEIDQHHHQQQQQHMLRVQPKHNIKNNKSNNIQQQHRLLQENIGVSLPGVSRPQSSSSSNIDHFELPTLRWMNLLPDDEEFLEGNTIKVSPFDESILYATSRTGNLLVLSAITGSTIETVKPSPRTLTEDGMTSTWSIYSNSGLTFGSYPIGEGGGGGGGKDSINKNKDNDNDKGYNEYLDYILAGGGDGSDWEQQVEEKNEDDQQRQWLRFVVYSVVDQAPSDSRFLPKTRVVCVSIPEHRILWTSAGLPGTPNGSPLVYHSLSSSSNDNNNNNDVSSSSSARQNGGDDGNIINDDIYVVLIHNSVLVRPDNTSRTTGHITVLEPINGHVQWTQSEWSRNEIPKGYGSPAISKRPIFGGESSGGYRDNPNDVIVWTSNDQDGRGRVGNLFAFQMISSSLAAEIQSTNNANTNDTTTTTYDPFETRVLRRVRWNSIARPVMNRNGTNLYAAVTGNAVRGWNGLAKFNETADWSKKLMPTAAGTNASSYLEDVALATAPVLSTDEETLFAVTAQNETICLNSLTGERMWSATTRDSSPILAEPVSSPDDERLYVIMSRDGRVVGIDQRNGKILWGFSCGAELLSSVCEKTSVLADFDLSSDGQYLYYGDVDGRIISLAVGEKRIDISNDNNEGYSTSTTVISDVNNKAQLDNIEGGIASSILNNDNNINKSVKKAGIAILAIILSFFVVGGTAMYVMKVKGLDLMSFVPKFNLRYFRFPRKGSPDEDSFGAAVGRGTFKVENRNDYHSKNSIIDGPDIYEDKIIATMSDDDDDVDPTIARGGFNTLWVDSTHSKPIADDDSQHPSIESSDRMAVLLGTSNRVTPINENFGYGQAVML
jgi:hypothetical protein